MNRKHVISGIMTAVILILIFSSGKPAETSALAEIATEGSAAVQTSESETAADDPRAAPTERVTHRITNPPTETPSPVPATPTPNPWKETVYSPTCDEAGYIIRENMTEGYTIIAEGAPALGHEYGEWKEDPETGMMVTTCTRCGKEIRRKQIYTGNIPRIDFTGSMDGISKADRVTLRIDYASPTENFSCYSYTTLQGHSTLDYPKKNYTIRLYENEEITEKHKVTFGSWQREHKFILKANYRDISQVRNLAAANLWADMAACRPNLFKTLKHTSNYGATDGFPVIVYLNDEFLGLYTLNLHIDDDLYQMNNAYDAVMIANSTEPEECRFYSEAAFTDQKTAWEVEFCGTSEDDQWAKDKLNELIRFVMTSDDEGFRSHLGEYLDTDGAIDYLIFLYATGLQSNAAKDLVLLKYHDCSAWIPSVYDMEGAFGFNLSTMQYTEPETFLPEKTDSGWDSETGSLLWDRLLQLFEEELRARYAELRGTVLTKKNIIDQINSCIARIPGEYYEQDLILYPRPESGMNPQEQMIQYIEKRFALLDDIWLN